MVLKLGTRRSLLAIAQSQQVAREVERLNPGIKVELVGIETQGDKIQDVALGKIEGKEFFVAELDHALRSKQTDFSVHSLKDLSLERSPDFTIAAIPARQDSRDVLLFHPDVVGRIKNKQPIRIGTSSPRRLDLLPGFLKLALPRFGEDDPRLVWVEIRGNVNSRLSRIYEPEDSPKKLDAVCLAAAGLSRLCLDDLAYRQMEPMLKKARVMLLPLSEVPPAPGQGALAVECRAEDSKVIKALQKLHNPETEEEIHQERIVLGEYGGGCHQRFGVSRFTLGRFKITRVFGDQKDEWRWDSTLNDQAEYFKNNKQKQALSVFDGSEYKDRVAVLKNLNIDDLKKLNAAPIWRVAHSLAWTNEVQNIYLERTEKNNFPRIWVAGSATWKALSARGVWVEASADSFGLDEQCRFSQEKIKFLDLKELSSSPILTHQKAAERCESKQSLGTYESQPDKTPLALIDQIKKAEIFYWNSFSQYEALSQYIEGGPIHCCGAGRTYDRFLSIGIKPFAFPNAVTFKRWIAK